MRLQSLFALAIIAVLTFSLSSCTDDELPVCVENILTDFRTEACTGGELTTWTFKGETVYCFDWGSCLPDQGIEIYSASCELICTLSSTVTICDGANWNDSATLIESIYRKG